MNIIKKLLYKSKKNGSNSEIIEQTNSEIIEQTNSDLNENIVRNGYGLVIMNPNFVILHVGQDLMKTINILKDFYLKNYHKKYTLILFESINFDPSKVTKQILEGINIDILIIKTNTGNHSVDIIESSNENINDKLKLSFPELYQINYAKTKFSKYGISQILFPITNYALVKLSTYLNKLTFITYGTNMDNVINVFREEYINGSKTKMKHLVLFKINSGNPLLITYEDIMFHSNNLTIIGAKIKNYGIELYYGSKSKYSDLLKQTKNIFPELFNIAQTNKEVKSLLSYNIKDCCFNYNIPYKKRYNLLGQFAINKLADKFIKKINEPLINNLQPIIIN